MKLLHGVFPVLILISSLFLILVPIRSIAGETTRIYVDPPVIVDPSVFFNVSINVENVTGLAGVQWSLTWNASFLKVVKMTEVMFHEVTPKTEWDNIWVNVHDIDNVAGIAEYAYLFADGPRAIEGGYCPINGSHTMAILTFQLVGVGNCSLQISNTILADFWSNAILHEVTGGSVSNRIEPDPIQPGPIEDSQLLFYTSPHRVKNDSLTVGSTFSANIDMQTIAEHRGIICLTFNLMWDATVLECIGATDIMFHEVTPPNETDNFSSDVYIMEGRVEILSSFVNFSRASEGGYSPIFGNHTVATMTFRVKSVGATLLHLERCWAFDVLSSTILHSSLDGFFVNRMNGDLNGDRLVDLFDALIFAKSFGAYLMVYPGHARWNEEADLNGDGQIDIFDAIQFAAIFRP
jgi:hypothetical protein